MLIIYVPYLLGYKAGSTLDLVANAAVVDDAIDLYQIIRKNGAALATTNPVALP